MNRNQSFFFFLNPSWSQSTSGMRLGKILRQAKTISWQCGVFCMHISTFAPQGRSACCLVARNVLAVDTDDINRVCVRLTALVKGGASGGGRGGGWVGGGGCVKT